jgi:hypothetical protein
MKFNEDSRVKIPSILHLMQLSAIKTIEKYAESYSIKTDTHKLRIDTSIIAADSLIALNAALEKLMLNGTKSMHIQTEYP